MSLINAGPTEGVAAGSCVTAVDEPAADALVGTAVALVVVVGEVLTVFVGAIVGVVTGGIAAGKTDFFVGAACGAQAASVRVSTNTVLKRNLIFILFSPSWACDWHSPLIYMPGRAGLDLVV